MVLLIFKQGCALRKIEGSPVLWNCKIYGARHMICMKNLRFSSCPKAKVRCQGPPGSARAQPCLSQGIRKKFHKEICKLLAQNTCWKSFLFQILKSMIFLLSTTEWICQLCCIWLIRAWYQDLVSWNGSIKGMSSGSVALSPSPVHHSSPFTRWLLLFHPIFLPRPSPHPLVQSLVPGYSFNLYSKACFHFWMSWISFAAKQSWMTLRMRRPLFVGSYLKVMWWALSQWKCRKICNKW